MSWQERSNGDSEFCNATAVELTQGASDLGKEDKLWMTTNLETAQNATKLSADWYCSSYAYPEVNFQYFGKLEVYKLTVTEIAQVL